MDSDDDTFDNVDSGNVSSGDDDFPMEVDMNCSKERQSEPEDYPFEVLTTEEIVQHMVDCIKDVNTVVEVSFFVSIFFSLLHVKSGFLGFSKFNALQFSIIVFCFYFVDFPKNIRPHLNVGVHSILF